MIILFSSTEVSKLGHSGFLYYLSFQHSFIYFVPRICDNKPREKCVLHYFVCRLDYESGARNIFLIEIGKSSLRRN